MSARLIQHGSEAVLVCPVAIAYCWVQHMQQASLKGLDTCGLTALKTSTSIRKDRISHIHTT